MEENTKLDRWKIEVQTELRKYVKRFTILTSILILGITYYIYGMDFFKDNWWKIVLVGIIYSIFVFFILFELPSFFCEKQINLLRIHEDRLEILKKEELFSIKFIVIGYNEGKLSVLSVPFRCNAIPRIGDSISLKNAPNVSYSKDLSINRIDEKILNEDYKVTQVTWNPYSENNTIIINLSSNPEG